MKKQDWPLAVHCSTCLETSQAVKCSRCTA